MRIDILTVVPELLTSPLNESILHVRRRRGSSGSSSTTLSLIHI